MANKNYTIMFLPHAEANFKKFQISKNRVIIIFSSLILFLGVTLYIFYNFFIFRTQLADYNQIKAKEAEWAKIATTYWSRIDSAVNKMNNYNSKINLLMSNLNYMGGGIGGEEEHGKGDQRIDLFSSILNDLKQDRANEFLTDFEMKLNQFEKEEDFFDHGYKNVSKIYQEMNEIVLQMPSICPADGFISSRFGYRKDPFTGKRSMHRGLDISNMRPNVPVIATADGTVILAGRDGGFGKTVVINHPFTNFR
ncbi:MAG: hypothetical protein A2161_16745, partial [Candidatus Schekmanbacteria bacterium RBG_13_48_7]